jgi:hypothetical protein
MNEDDADYKRLLKIEKKVKVKKKELKYKLIAPKCCLTCKNSFRDCIESTLECNQINPEQEFSLGGVDNLGKCDAYKKSEYYKNIKEN